jgi:hypothetical protein
MAYKVNVSYSPQRVIGKYFEDNMLKLFGCLRRSDIFDLESKNGTFYVEVKSSAYDNGGVITVDQLKRYEKFNDVPRFYFLPYHNLPTKRSKITESFDKPAKLRKALRLEHFFIFPYSIVDAYEKYLETNGKIRKTNSHGDFVQMRLSKTRNIFNRNSTEWDDLGLDCNDYDFQDDHGIQIVSNTKYNHLVNELMDSMHPDVLLHLRRT